MHGSSETTVTTSPTGYAFIAVAYTAMVLLAGSNLPTPLYPTYQRLFHLSPLTVTLVYATYAFTVMPSLAVFGPLSDAVGRRRVLLGAIAAAAVAAVLFALAWGTAWLFVAQVVEGIAMGALQGRAVAALLESHPRGDAERAALVGSSATVAGAAVGPLLAGVLAQYAPWPRRLPYLVEALLLIVALVAVWKVYPHHVAVARARGWRPRRPSVPPAMRRTFALPARCERRRPRRSQGRRHGGAVLSCLPGDRRARDRCRRSRPLRRTAPPDRRPRPVGTTVCQRPIPTAAAW